MDGLNEAMFSVAKHSGTASAVNKPAIAHSATGNISDIIRLKICDLFISNS
jgi:hypothetical protein